MHYIQFQLPLTTMWADTPFCLLDWWEEKEALTELLHTLKVATAQTSGLINLVFSWQLVFSECGYLFIGKPIQVITEPVEPSTRPLGLGSKTISQQGAMHASQNLTKFMQSLSHVRQNQVISKRKALIAGGKQALFSCWPLLKIKKCIFNSLLTSL